MTDAQLVHTADLGADRRAAVRLLMSGVFDDLDDDTFDDVLGGWHALVFDDTDLVGHASVVQRRMLHGGSGVAGRICRGRGGAGGSAPAGAR